MSIVVSKWPHSLPPEAGQCHSVCSYPGTGELTIHCHWWVDWEEGSQLGIKRKLLCTTIQAIFFNCDIENTPCIIYTTIDTSLLFPAQLVASRVISSQVSYSPSSKMMVMLVEMTCGVVILMEILKCLALSQDFHDRVMKNIEVVSYS